MKKIALLILPILLYISCTNDESFPKTENITSGSKWTLQIGSTPTEVYKQLQELGTQKNFNDLGISNRKPFLNPNELKSDLSLYRAITLQSPSEVIERVLIQFDQNKVKEIEKGGALLNPIAKWPENMSDEATILLNDPIDGIKQKLLSIYQDPTYKDYKIILSNKWLEKPFDTDMANYNEWNFTFDTDISTSRSGSSSVYLFFKNDKLSKIQHIYNENDTMN
ncbi:hypothetical protein [Flavobacterium sp. TAB 87]|uniref:hypothetical protein n=1 Tax=Flavobacterium sp. TAB 87 TaxID=1729581 RepID=UPI00076C95CA|nr:hypothetical protein [Flavobacterium sp. TAB 87]KVV15026.1 hypothetical protein AP058_01584 [Flavobacterium sp. TAB 87]